MVRSVNNFQSLKGLPKCMINAGKKATEGKKLDLPAKVILASLGIANAIKEPVNQDVFEMKCSEYEYDGECPLFSCNPYP